MTPEKICIIIGASHAGVNCAFALRRQGWLGEIVLHDSDVHLPYHRPPLSKGFLSGDDDLTKHLLKPAISYEKAKITLALGSRVAKIKVEEKLIQLDDGDLKPYDKLVIATGARPLIPRIPGIENNSSVFPLRCADDAVAIRSAFHQLATKKVVIIGGGYIGLEVAASLKKMGGAVCVLERENRVLARVTAPVMSTYFEQLHASNGVQIFTQKNVKTIEPSQTMQRVICTDDGFYPADMILLGVGIRVNHELAQEAGLQVGDGIHVDQSTRTSDSDIYAIGDCTNHYNRIYDRRIRLESVQNAVDQSKVAAAAICGKDSTYDALPWFWSDQFNVKFQSVGLSSGYDEALLREEKDEKMKRSVWYFKGDRLLAVDAANHPKAYVVGTKIIKGGEKIDRNKLLNPNQDLKPANLIIS